MGEILAAALQEGRVASVVGTTTAGEVAGSIVVPLSDGSAIQVTTLRIDSGFGTVLNNIGVIPNIDVEMTVNDAQAGVDRQLDAALTQVRSMVSDTPSPTSSTPNTQPAPAGSTTLPGRPTGPTTTTPGVSPPTTAPGLNPAVPTVPVPAR
jgi:carboxyl-terminal processing protease